MYSQYTDKPKKRSYIKQTWLMILFKCQHTENIKKKSKRKKDRNSYIYNVSLKMPKSISIE